jgi:predicted lactoylglutathione lyase
MNFDSIFLNLPIKYLQKRSFSINEQYVNDKALCLYLKEETVYAMLITRQLFNAFTKKTIANETSTQVFTTISLESKAQGNGCMNHASFEDSDEQQWDVNYTDLIKLS